MAVRPRCIVMTSLPVTLAAMHDHWDTEPLALRVGTSTKLWWHRLERHHPTAVAAAEWSGATLLAVSLVCAELIANA